MAAADYYTQVYTMFVGYYGRPPAQSGLEYYAGLVDKAGGNLAVVIDDFFKSAESQAFFAGKSVEQQVNQIFQNLFGRDALPAGLNYWAGQINSGAVALSQAAYTIAFNAAAADVAVRDAKVASAKAWVAGLDTTAEILAFGTDAGRTAGRDFLKAVTTSTPATQTATDAALKAMVDGGSTNPGQTFTLTTGIDNIVGTSGNDTIIGGSGSAGAASTLGSADVINGGGGTDTLKLTTEGGAAVSATPNLTSVEKVFVQATTTVGGTTVNMVNATGTTEIWNERSTDAVGLAVTNVQELAAVGVKGEITGASKYQVAFKDSLAVGVADSITIALDGAKITDLGVGGMTAANEFETLNISATGTSTVTNLIQGTGAGALAATKTVNVTGAGKVTVTSALAATVTTVDASANTGGASFDLSATGAVKATGGAGNDTFKLGASLTTADVVTGGDGTDIIGVTTGASLVTGLQVTGFETLDIGGGNAAGAAVLANTYDLSKLAGITTLKVGSAINADAGTNDVTTINNLAKGAGVEINAALGTGAGDQLVVNVKDAGAGSPNDVIGVTVSGAAGVTTGGDLVIADIETVNLTASTTATTPITHTISALNVNQALTVAVLDGSAALTITDLNSTSLVLFDATAATKAVSVATVGGTAFTATNGVAFKAGAAADTLDLTGSIAAGVVTGSKFYVTGNGGGDTITLTNVAASNAAVATNGSNGIQETVVYLAASDSQAGTTAAGVNKFDTITNFDAETVLTTTQDFIDLKALGFTGTQAAAFTKAVGTAITATGGVAAADATSFFVNAGQKAAVAVVTSGADVWLFVDADKDGNYAAASDMAIKLVGVAAADVTSTDFIFA